MPNSAREPIMLLNNKFNSPHPPPPTSTLTSHKQTLPLMPLLPQGLCVWCCPLAAGNNTTLPRVFHLAGSSSWWTYGRRMWPLHQPHTHLAERYFRVHLHTSRHTCNQRTPHLNVHSSCSQKKVKTRPLFCPVPSNNTPIFKASLAQWSHRTIPAKVPKCKAVFSLFSQSKVPALNLGNSLAVFCNNWPIRKQTELFALYVQLLNEARPISRKLKRWLILTCSLLNPSCRLLFHRIINILFKYSKTCLKGHPNIPGKVHPTWQVSLRYRFLYIGQK